MKISDQKNMQKSLKYIIPVFLFVIISYAYFSPLLEGKRLEQHDFKTFKGGAKELIDYREKTGEEALWTNSMFGGMPGYLISVRYKGNILQHLNKVLQPGPRPASQLILLLLGGYILFLALRINPWLSFVGAVALAFSSYNFIILLAGHNSKVIAIAYAAPVLASIFLTFRGKRILGATLTGIFLSLQILAGHPQITYYTLIIVLFYGLSELYFNIKDKTLKSFLYSFGLLSVAVVFAVLSNYSRLATTLEYDNYSMRTKSELSVAEDDKTDGLPLSYATNWSYGVDENFTLLIPDFKGGSSTYNIGKNSNTYEALAKLDKNFARNFVQSANMYWGTQASTSGPIYIGAIVLFLFVLGFFILDGRYKWWILAVTILGVMLSWGKNFMPLTEFFMHFIPGYSKFRTVSMTLVIPQLVMPILAILTLKKIIFDSPEKDEIIGGLKWAAGITGGFALLFLIFPSMAGNFSSQNDMRMVSAMSGSNPQVRQMLTENLIPALEADRMSMLRTDAFRSLIFILLTAGFIYYYKIKNTNISVNLVIAIFGLLIIVDLWPVDRRFLNHDNFTSKSKVEKPYSPTKADQYIIQSEGLNERVLNLTTSPFQDANTSYFHHSLGGYHGAKMRRFQDLMNTRLMDELSTLIGTLQSRNPGALDSTLQDLNIINMLNTKYFIVNPNGDPIVNPHAMGNAWFVEKLEDADNADDELQKLTELNLPNTAVTDKQYMIEINQTSFKTDPGDKIELVEYAPNKLTYKSLCNTVNFAVFSEIFYNKGWNVKIDGKPAEYIRVNYLLRGMEIPPGEHQVIFEFKPEKYYNGEKISYASSLILLLMFVGAIMYEARKNPDQPE